MPKFSYKAKEGPGEIVDGVIEADNLDQAILKIAGSGLTPVDVTLTTKEAPREKKDLLSSIPFFRKIPTAAVTIFTRQICDLVEAAVPLLRSLNIVAKQTQNAHLKDIVQKMHTTVKDGGSFSDALDQFPDVFPKIYVNMVRSGEVSGQLHVILNRLADLMEKDQETRGKVVTSLAYPVFIVLVGFATMFILLTFVIPRLTHIFGDLNQSLPLLTVVVMKTSDFLARFWWLIIGLIAFACFYCHRLLSTQKGRVWFSAIKLKMPIFGKYINDVEVGRFARTLGTLQESGVVIVSALNSVWPILENEVLKEEVKKAAAQVANGVSLTNALKESRYFPESAINMIAVGEETGNMEKGLHKLADACEREADRTSRTIVSLLGPAVLVFIVSIIGLVIIAMLLPLLVMNLIV